MDEQLKRRLQLLKQEQDPLKKSLLFLCIFTDALKSEDIKPILVGGRALEFYTLGGYATKDIDLVLNGRAEADIVLKEMGFQKQPGERHWYHEELSFYYSIGLPLRIISSCKNCPRLAFWYSSREYGRGEMSRSISSLISFSNTASSI